MIKWLNRIAHSSFDSEKFYKIIIWMEYTLPVLCLMSIRYVLEKIAYNLCYLHKVNYFGISILFDVVMFFVAIFLLKQYRKHADEKIKNSEEIDMYEKYNNKRSNILLFVVPMITSLLLMGILIVTNSTYVSQVLSIIRFGLIVLFVIVNTVIILKMAGVKKNEKVIISTMYFTSLSSALAFISNQCGMFYEEHKAMYYVGAGFIALCVMDLFLCWMIN